MQKGDRMKNKKDFGFPKFQKSITDFMNDEDGNISRRKLLSIGTMIVLLGTIFSMNVSAKHGSHGSHGSHSSTSYRRNHSNSHNSHSNFHSSHASHTSHSNTAAHSNSNYSAGGDYYTTPAPKASTITESAIKTPVKNDFLMPIPDPNVTIPIVPTVPNSPAIFAEKQKNNK